MAKKPVINVDLIYPIGAIYLSTSAVNPKNIFGGVWEQLKDRFLLGAGNTYINGDTGGEATHTLTVNEMPSHRHSLRVVKDNETNSHGYFPKGNNSQGNNNGWADAIDTDNANNALGYTGGNQAHNNMPPYLVVYMWKRVS